MSLCFDHDHATYALQSESTLYSCLNVKELLARSRREISSVSDCNWTRNHNHLVNKKTLNHLAKLVSLAKWLSVSELTGCEFESSCSHLIMFKFDFTNIYWIQSPLVSGFRQKTAHFTLLHIYPEVAVCRCSLKQIFLKVLQFHRKTTLQLVFSREFGDIFKNNIFYRAPPLAAFFYRRLILQNC